ncbi:MAG TPA: hypothetical protein VLZ05_08205 [Mycobacterium sp.]|nr:hypothetical protein [Mycobacterium sp.]
MASQRGIRTCSAIITAARRGAARAGRAHPQCGQRPQQTGCGGFGGEHIDRDHAAHGGASARGELQRGRSADAVTDQHHVIKALLVDDALGYVGAVAERVVTGGWTAFAVAGEVKSDHRT